MSERTRITLVAAALAVLVLSASFIVILSLGEGGLIFGPKVYRYSDTPTVEPSKSEIEALLASLAPTMTPSNLSLLYGKLSGVIQIGSTNDVIGEYTRTLFYLSGNLSLIKSQINATRVSLESGNRSEAGVLVGELEQHREQSRTLLQSSYSLLNQIGEQYQIDTTSQLSRLNALDQLYNNYSAQIDQLASELVAQTSLVQTILNLTSPSREAFIGENLLVYGSITMLNGTALGDRYVTISWGYNMTNVRSNLQGKFEENISFPIGYPAGLAIIRATFSPSGQDSVLYQGSTVQVQVQVAYQPSTVVAQIHPTNVKPLGVVDIWGNLSTTNLKPIENRTMVVMLDGTSLGNATTSKSGFFYFYFYVPRKASNGTHLVEVAFNATNDRFAPSNTTLTFSVETLETKAQIAVDRNISLSGMNLGINGTISYVNSTYYNQTAPPSGNVTIFIDSVPYTNMTLNAQGSFSSSIQVPFGIGLGSHNIAVQYQPDQPWIQSSQATVSVFTLSTPVIVIVAAAIVSASTLGTYAARRSRRRSLQREALLVQPSKQKEETFLLEFSEKRVLAAIETESTNASRIKRAYNLAQLMIGRKLDVDRRDAETPSEYLSRVLKTAASLKDSLTPIVGLFEFAEYSPYPIEDEQVREVKEKILALREELENVKTGEDYTH